MINFHEIDFSPKYSETIGWLEIPCKVLLAEINVEALSLIIKLGKDLRATNLRKAHMNSYSEQFSTISKWMALVTAHVNSAIYTLAVSNLETFTFKDPE